MAAVRMCHPCFSEKAIWLQYVMARATLEYFKGLGDLANARTSPSWLNRDTKQMSGAIQRLPERAEIDGFLNEQLIVEYYSR